MPDRISLNLPWPPCLNHYKQVGPIRRTKTGKLFQATVNTPETNKYYFHVNCLVRQNKLAEGLKFATDSTISVGASIYLYPPDRRRRDIDGVFKVLLDS